jgi:uncharacterized protein
MNATSAGLAIALLGPSLFVVISDGLFGPTPRLTIQVVLQLLYCLLPIAIVWIVIAHERLPLRSIGLRRPTWRTVAWGLLLWAGVWMLSLLTAPLLRLTGSDGLDEGLQRISVMPLWFRFVVGVTGGLVEETLYRGYAVERLSATLGSPWLGGLIAVTAFALAHVPTWGLGFALAADLPFGIVMTLFYLWKRDLLANSLAHSAGLVVGLLAVP